MISDYLANNLLDHVLKNTAYTSPATVYLALLKAIPLRATATPASEVSGGSYVRKAVTFGSAANQRSLNTAAVTFDVPSADWATVASPIIAIALMDAESSGNWLFAHILCEPRIVLNGDPAPKFEINSIKALLDPTCGC